MSKDRRLIMTEAEFMDLVIESINAGTSADDVRQQVTATFQKHLGYLPSDDSVQYAVDRYQHPVM